MRLTAEVLIPKVEAGGGARLRRSRDDFTSNYNGKVGASQLSRVNLASGLPRPALELMGGKASSLGRCENEEEEMADEGERGRI